MTVAPAPSNKGKRFPAIPLEREEVIRLLDGCSGGWTGTRNRAMIALIWRSGLRVEEALDLMPADLNMGDGTAMVRHGKGNRARLVVFDRIASVELQSWMAAREEEGFNLKDHALFCNTRGQRLEASYPRHMLKRIAGRVGIVKRVHPHQLRHTHAFELAREGIELVCIADQLGHASVATTDTYIRHLSPQKRIQCLRNRRPA